MTTFSPVARPHGARCLASRLIGCGLTNGSDEGGGVIDDLVLDSGYRRLAYAVVSFGGFFGLGGKSFAMPWHRLAIGDLASGQAVCATMNVARVDLLAAPAFDKGNWPDFADVRWAALVEAHYRPGHVPESVVRFAAEQTAWIAAGHGVERPAVDADSAHHRLSQLLGMDVVDSQHAALASVEDLVLDVRRGTVDGVLLAFGGGLGMGERTVLVPADALVFDADEDVFVLASNRERLQAMAIQPGAWPALDSDEWLVGAHERLAMASAVVAREGSEEAPPVPVDEVAPAATGFGGLLEQVRGTIVALGSASKQSKGEPRLRLRVRSDDGREVVVLAGAIANEAQASLALRTGQAVDVRGWRASQGPQSMLILGSLTVDGKTVDIDEAPPGEISMPQ